MLQEQRDPSDTIAAIEDAEIEAEVQRRLDAMQRTAGDTPEAIAASFGRVLIWCLEAETVAKAGLRVHVVATKLNLDVGRGASNAQLAARMGFGRSAAHKLSKQFSQLFGVKGPHDRSPQACQSYQDAWRKSQEDRRARRPRAAIPA